MVWCGSYLRISLVCAAMAVLGACEAVRAADFAGGTGQPNDPYQIATAEQLTAIGSERSLLDRHFALVNDIDLDPNLPGGRVFSHSLIASTAGWDYLIPGPPFTGILNGQGHRVANLVFQGDASFLGLIGEIGEGGMVQDVRLEGVRIEGPDGKVRGALAGSNKGTVLRCRASGSITGSGYLGGLVGRNSGIIRSCRSDCSVDGYGNAWSLGGLLGSNDSGMVSDCYATGSVSVFGKGDRAGGFVGIINEGTLSRCYASGPVSGTEQVGGLAAAHPANTVEPRHGAVRHCFWDTDTTGQTWSMGGFGRTTAQMKSAATFIGWGAEWTIREGQDYPRLAWEQAAGLPLADHPPRTYSGKGDPNEPFILRDANDLFCVMSRSEDWSCTFELHADIDMRDKRTFLPLADFTGSLDGKGHAISNLMIHEDSIHLGLIGCLEAGTIRNLSLTDVDIEGTGLQSGALVALNLAGRITRCSMSGNMGTTGVVRNGTWYSCDVGGLVGASYRGYIEECSALPRIVGERGFMGVGGLIGLNNTGPVVCSRTAVDISVDDTVRVAAGFVGSNGGSITNCFASGSVVRKSTPGKKESYVYWRTVSGFAGDSCGGIVHCCASTRVVQGDESCSEAAGFLSQYSEGGLGCFWDTEVSGCTDRSNATGLTTAQMQQAQTYIRAGWDLVGERINGTSDLWFMPPEGGYPQLVAFSEDHRAPQLVGSGTLEDPYRVATAEDLGAIRHGDRTACYRLMSDIDLLGIIWSEPPIPEFDGRFDGDGHVVSNLTIHGGSDLGLFGRLGSRAKVVDLGLQDVRIEGDGRKAYLRIQEGGRAAYLGCLAGTNVGTIEACWSVGTVLGGDDSRYLGGLVGDNAGRITACHTAGDVSGGRSSWWLGGLAGTSSHNIAHCTSMVTVSGGKDCWLLGGLLGEGIATITDCHAEGHVSVGEQAYLIGGLMGESQGPVMDCSARGDVICAGKCIGGLIGRNLNAVSGSCATGKVSGGAGGEAIGGLIGRDRGGPVTDCYATGPVSGGTMVGGLIGWEEGTTVARCYAAGRISALGVAGGLIGDEWGQTSSSFWDTQTSNMATSAAGVGRPTDQMHHASTFTGWDFVNVWSICEGKDYPRLRWEQVTCE